MDDLNQRQRLLPGSVFMHGPNQPHQWRSPWGMCRRLVVCFQVDPPMHLSLPQQWPCWDHLLPEVWRMLRIADQAMTGWVDRVHARLAMLMTDMLRFTDRDQELSRTSAVACDALAQRVDTFLDDNFASPIRLNDVALNMGVSLSTLTHQYQQQRGQTVGQRLLSLRMEQAAYLLRETQLPLEQIAQQIGIGQSPYFCRLFKKQFRRTPTQYRQNR
jgi:AraC-like DNA-binding protein